MSIYMTTIPLLLKNQETAFTRGNTEAAITNFKAMFFEYTQVASSSNGLAPHRCGRFAGWLVFLACVCSPGVAFAAKLQPTLTLTVSSTVGPVTTVSSGTVVTLTATLAGGAPRGQVTFCDASAAYCTDIHLLNTAQVTSAGTATFAFIPGIGVHAYKAVYLGTNNNVASSSTVSELTVTGTYPTTTTIQQGGTAGNYTLTATVVGTGSQTLPLTGMVSFPDTSNSNQSLGMASLGVSTAGFGFLSSATPQTGTGPTYLAVVDFNGDGIPDLVTLNGDAYFQTLTVLLGNGDGTFKIRLNTPVGPMASSMVPGDFNGDGIPDLALANFGDNTVLVLLGQGNGFFSAGSRTTVGQEPNSLAAGDFNGDGIPDLAVANFGDNTVVVLLGQGNGSFGAGSRTTVGQEPTALAVGDFNGDGIPDLVFENLGDSTVTVLLGKGDGTFTIGSSQSFGNPSALAVGDFNGDGIPDLAVADLGDSTVTVLLGKGDGTFTIGSNATGGQFPASLAVGDFNGDGIPDLAVATFGDHTVTVLLGKGDGTFAVGSTQNDFGETSVAVGDFNGDGIPDLAAVATYTDTVTVGLTQLTQTATASVSGISPAGMGLHAVDATYPGNSNYSGSTSGTVSLSAAQVMTGLTLSATPPGGSTYGQQVMLTATLNPSAEQGYTTNGEKVTFYSGSTNLGVGSLASGIATLNVTSLPVGVDSLTASYIGDTNFMSSNASPVSFTVTGATPSITFSVPNQTYGVAPFMVSATSNSTGAITYSVVSGPATISGSTVTLNGTGTVVLHASQAAAGNYAAGSQNASFTVSAPATPVTLQFASTTLVYPLPPAFEVTIAQQGKLPPTGSVTILDGSSVVGKYPVLKFTDGHSFGLVLPPLNVGKHSITAVYSGDQNYSAGTSAAVTVTVTPGPVMLHVSCGNPGLHAGQALSCQILALEILLPVDGTFSYALNDGPGSDASLNNGRAAITVSDPPAGNDVLTLTYAAQGNYQAAPTVTVRFSVASH